jgi:hypothetical protein
MIPTTILITNLKNFAIYTAGDLVNLFHTTGYDNTITEETLRDVRHEGFFIQGNEIISQYHTQIKGVDDIWLAVKVQIHYGEFKTYIDY